MKLTSYFFVSALCNEIKLVEHINHVVTWDEKQWKVSPGQHISALIINTLCGRVPLYRVEKFYEDQDVEGLFGVGRKAEDFNHFALGRALDTFYEAGSKSIFTALTLRNLLNGSAPLQFAHGDTTSKVMYGDYKDKGDPDTLNITQGYSKDKRFDLKQIVGTRHDRSWYAFTLVMLMMETSTIKPGTANLWIP